MALVADILLVAGALGAAFYCMILSRRLRRFDDLETGMGGAIAVLSAQVDDMTQALKGAQSSARTASSSLGGLTERAEGVAQRLELLVASLHDIPLPDTGPEKKAPAARPTASENAPRRPAMNGHADVGQNQPETAPLAFMRSASSREKPLILREQSGDGK